MNTEYFSASLRGMCVFTALVAAAWLTGCAENGPADSKDLQAWLHQERVKHAQRDQPSHTQPSIPGRTVLAAAAKPAQSIYPQAQSVEPFNRQRLLKTAAADAPQPAETTRLALAPSQIRQPLEALPLAGMRLVGSLQRGGETLALLRVQGLIYAVRVGDKIGQDQGRVKAISLADLLVREVAHNAQGQASERIVSLALVPEP